MRLCPSSPLLLPIPSGQISVAEFIRIQVEFSADAHRNTILALYSIVFADSASMISTPVAFFVSLSNKTLLTIENGLNVRLFVAIAAGSVDDCVLKYAPNGQPSQHLLRY